MNVLELNLRERETDLERALEAALEKARKRLLLTTPYFVPPFWFRQALLRVARRGVDVRVLTAGRSDVPFICEAGRHLYGLFLAGGLRIYEMRHPTLHAKTMTADGCYSIIGSYNVDEYGRKHNLEVGVAV